MNRFDYIRPATVSEAVAVLGSAYLAAGTNLLDLRRAASSARGG
jgi:xanthine dehydrogenase YagS FAD-binding subunit